MLVGLIAAGAYSFASRQDRLASTFRFDASGARQPVSSNSPRTSALQGLQPKPEPSAILQSDELTLSRSQRVALEAIDRQWMADRTDLEAKMSRAVAAVQGAAHVTIGDLQAAGERVGELSRTFELRRAQAWANALATLSKDQLDKLEVTR